jgi:O-antigen ligase
MAAKKLDKPRNDARFVLVSAGIITLFFFTSIKDPFNAPKLWLTILGGAFLMGHLLSDLLLKKFTDGRKEIKILGFIVLSFTSFLFIAALATNVKYVAFFGESQRNTGFLAYFFLAIFLLSAAKHFRLQNINLLYITGISVGALMTFYGVLQHFGNDFVKWNNPYNSVISTVGNPDFAAAIMAVFLVLAFAAIFATNWHVGLKVVIGLLVVVTLQVIQWSQARQGLLSFGVAGGLFVLIFVWQKNRILGILSTIGYLIVFVLGLLGIYQVGPLTQYLFKPSVTVRGFYWRAGIQMFLHHPLFGVGVDRYGAAFRLYREAQYPVNYGFDLTSTAAHNVPIQIFAMGGIFVGLSYLSVLCFIAYRGTVGIKRTSGKNRLLVAGVFCAWVAYEAQSIVSIDNIGIAIWGWVLGGAVIGVSLVDRPAEKLAEPEKAKRASVKQSNLTLATPIISAVLVLGMFIVVSTQFRAESQMFNVSRYAVPTDQANRNAYHPLIRRVVDIPWMNPMYKLELGSKLAQAGFVDEGFAEIDKVIVEDSQSYAGLGLEASFYEQLHKFDKAIILREKMVALDPWGAQNYLTLGRDYLAVGSKPKALEVGKKIVDISKHVVIDPKATYPSILQAAHTELGA